MSRTGHKSIYPGQRALVRLCDGTVFVDRFVADHDRFITFAEHGRVASDRIRTVTPYRPLEGSQLCGEAQRDTCVFCTNTYQAREAAKMLTVAGKKVCRGCARILVEQFFPS